MTRAKAPRLRVAGLVALVASSAVTAGVILAIPPSAVVGHEPVCGAIETDTSNVGTIAVEAFGVGCGDDLRAVSHRSKLWPQQRAAAKAPAGEVRVKPSHDQAATWTAIALAESGGSTGT